MELLCEGSIDFDREDFLVRDRLYVGREQENGIISKINEDTNLSQTKVNKNIENIYTYKDEDLKYIKQFLNIRENMYENEYHSPKRKMLEYVPQYFINKILLAEKCTQADSLRRYLKQFTSKDIKEIDINEYIKGTDILWYNGLIDIIRNSQDEEIKQIALLLMPSNNGLINIAINTLDPKNSEQSEYSEEEKEYIKNVKYLIDENKKDEEIQALRAKNAKECITIKVKTQEQVERIKHEITKILNKQEVLGFEVCKQKLKKYKQSEPIYIEDNSKKIKELSEYNEDNELDDVNSYCAFLVGPILRLEGIDEKRIEEAVNFLRQQEKVLNASVKEEGRMRLFKTENKPNMDWFEER